MTTNTMQGAWDTTAAPAPTDMLPRMTLALACAQLQAGVVQRYVPSGRICGCGRCGA